LIGGSYLGVHLDEVTTETARRLGLREERGALLTDIVADSPAAKAGLQKDDVIIEWNGSPVESAMQFQRLMGETPAGRTVRLGVIRNGREMTIDVKLGDRSDASELRKLRGRLQSQELREQMREAQERLRESNKQLRQSFVISGRGRLGVTTQSLTPQLAGYFGLSGRSGALINSVVENSPAAKAGLRAGDVIVAIDGQAVDDPGDVSRLIRGKAEGPVEVRVLRDRREQTLTVTLEKRETSEWFFDPEEFEGIFKGIIIDPQEIVIPMPELKFESQPLVIPMPQIKVQPGRVFNPTAI
jgi:serine protease Do